MTAASLARLLEAKNLTPSCTMERQVTCGGVCDVLSWMLAHGQKAMAWITVQTHLNVIAVAVLKDMAAVILPESLVMDETVLKKAVEEGIIVLSTPLTAYEVCAKMVSAGIPGK